MSENKSEIGLSWAPKVPPLSCGTKNTLESRTLHQNYVWKHENELVDGLFVPPSDPRKLNMLLKKNVKDQSGKSWFDMPAPTITPEIKKDLEILKLRSVIDPKRHYKKGDSRSKVLPKYYRSRRLTKKERKATIADELLSDPSLGAYRKRKVREIEEELHPSGTNKWKIRGRQTLKRAKERRRAQA